MLGRIYPLAVLLVFADVVLKTSCIHQLLTEKGSLTFVIDDTWSMTDDINQVKSSVSRIMDIVFTTKASIIGNMVLVTFNDPDAHVRVVTNKREEFNKALKAVEVHGNKNYDCPEMSMQGLILALKNSNRGSHIYVFTDASAKDHKDAYLVKQLCQEKQSQISFVITGRCTVSYPDKMMSVYYEIAQACSGLAYEVNKNEVSEVLRPITDIISGEKVIIKTTTVPPRVLKDISFEIDEQTEYVIVSVTGMNVYLKLSGPTGKQENLMWNANGKVVKLVGTKPGKYIATVKGESQTSVVIVGRSDFLFKHGFSEQKPKSLNDTTLQPIANTNIYLSVFVSDERQTVEITTAQILGMNDTPITADLPLTKVSKDFYISSPFVTPTVMFKVVVKGKVRATGHFIKRISSIPVTPSKPKIIDMNKLDPLSDEFIALINSKQKTWKAGRNFPKNTSFTNLKSLLGTLEDKYIQKLEKADHVGGCINLPESFDPRDKWTNCTSLNEIRDQGQCGSCWAFGAVTTMTDRYCIFSGGKLNFHFSAQDLITGCRKCGGKGPCGGGWPSLAFQYWQKCGIVSGGNTNTSTEGCKRYSLPPPEICEKKCDTDDIDYVTDKRRGKKVYSIAPNEESIKVELYQYGPVEVIFKVYSSFFHYKQGVYTYDPQEQTVQGLHAVKVLGWGVENGVKYWLVANSWGTKWGDKGFFKIRRGQNDCGIEESIVTGVPLYP